VTDEWPGAGAHGAPVAAVAADAEPVERGDLVGDADASSV
jgi:hypothetical protein